MGRRRTTEYRCSHIMGDGVQCERGGTWRDQMNDRWLCGRHKNSGKRAGVQPGSERLTKGQRIYRRQLKRKRRKKGVLDCDFATAAGHPCQAPVSQRLEDGRNVCQHHWRLLQNLDPIDQNKMELAAVDSLLDRKINKVKKRRDVVSLTRRQVVDMPDIEEQIEKLEEYNAKQPTKIQFREPPKPKINDKGQSKLAFFGIDVEHYTPEFKVDYVYMLIAAIRRTEAVVNILFQQLQRIEAEEQELKEVHEEGKMPTMNGGMADYNKKITRNATPVELKIKLLEALSKHESRYASLLKQMEELPLTCLMVMRKLGVRWDREAAVMVVNKLEKENKQILSDFGALDVKPEAPLSIKEAMDIVQHDPSIMKGLKPLMADDGW